MVGVILKAFWPAIKITISKTARVAKPPLKPDLFVSKTLMELYQQFICMVVLTSYKRGIFRLGHMKSLADKCEDRTHGKKGRCGDLYL